MVRQRIAAGLAVLVIAGVVGVVGSASATHCAWHGDLTQRNVPAGQRALDNGDVNSVAPGEYNRYNVDLPAGFHYVILQGSGDVDLVVCKGGNEVCRSENPVMVDGCAADGLQEQWPGVGNVLEGAGTYEIMVRHCMDASCSWPADAPDLEYVILWQTL